MRFMPVSLVKETSVPRTADLHYAQPLDYNSNGTYQRYSGYDVLNIQQSDVITAAEFQWRQIALNVVASGLELRTNSGGNAILKLAKARIKNAMRTFKNNFSYRPLCGWYASEPDRRASGTCG
jgi:hypothetical protein